MRDAESEVEVEAGLLPSHGQLGHPLAHGGGHPHRALRRIGHRHRVVEEDHHAVAREALQRRFRGHHELAHLGVILAQHGHDLLGLRGLGEGREAAKIEEDHGDLAPVALQGILGASGHDHLGELGREEALELAQAVELGDLFRHAGLERLVEEGQLVPELLDPEERANPGQELRLVDGLGQEVVGARLDPLDALLTGIERGHHDHGQPCRLRSVANGPAHLVSAHLGHDDIEEHDVGRLGGDLLERLLARGCRGHGIAARAQDVGEELDVVSGVVDDEDARGIAHGRLRSVSTASRKLFTLMGLLW